MEYLLFTDETNQQPAADAKFFIYGGVFFPTDKLKDVHNLVEEVREINNYRPKDEFKFDTRSRPNYISQDQHKAAKNAVLDGCMQLGVNFVACLVLHNISAKHTLKTLISWGANSVFFAFERFLQEENATGIAIVDRLPFSSSFQFLQEKFQLGLTFPRGENRKLERIHLFGFSCIGASNACSAIDIILGAFRYCINKRERIQVACDMLPKIIRMMWHRRENNDVKIREYGLLFRPKEVRRADYKREYDELTLHLANILMGRT
jgi:hypothetical protein